MEKTAGKPGSKSNLESKTAEQHWQAVSRSVVQAIRNDSDNSRKAGEPKKRMGPTKDNRCWVCREPLDQPKKGRLRLTCSNACRQARYRRLKGQMSWEFKREKKIVERRRSKPFIERRFDKTFFEPVFELNAWLKWYECLACGQPYEVNRMKSGAPLSPYCSDKCEKKTKYQWNKFVDAYERAHQRGEVDKRVEERFWYDKLSPLCPHCGKPFAPNTTLHGKRKPGRPRKYCSDACRKAAYERRWKIRYDRARVHRYRNCLECGERYDRTDTMGRRRMIFCGPCCGNTFRHRVKRTRKRLNYRVSGRRYAILNTAKNKAARKRIGLFGGQDVSLLRTGLEIEEDRNIMEIVASGGEAEMLCVESG